MTEKGDRPNALFEQGYNCAQAVFGAFCEETGYNFESAMLLASAFGGGMGRMREVCGAVSGMMLVTSLLYGYNKPKAITEKKELYQTVQTLANRFKEKNGSIVCRELLGIRAKDVPQSPVPALRTPDYYKKRPCPLLIKDAAEILEEYIQEHPPVNQKEGSA